MSKIYPMRRLHVLLFAILFYAALPALPGALLLECGESVESARIARGRATTVEAVPALSSQPFVLSRAHVDVTPGLAPAGVVPLVRRHGVTKRLLKAHVDRSPLSEDPLKLRLPL